MKFWATEYVKTAGYAGSSIGSAVGGGIPGLAGYYMGVGDTPEENRGWFRPTFMTGLGTAGGAILGGLAGQALGDNLGMDPDTGKLIGATTGGLAGGVGGGYIAGRQQRNLPR